jgi:hypothetical protein
VAAQGIDAFLRTEVAPFLAELGYVKDKRLYRRRGEDGSTAIVQFEKLAVDEPDVIAFEPQCGVATLGGRPWRNADLQAETTAKPVKIGDAQYVVRVRAAEEFDLQRLTSYPISGRWGVGPAQMQTAGETLRNMLTEYALPVLDRVLAGERDADVLSQPEALPVLIAHKPFTRPRVWN